MKKLCLALLALVALPAVRAVELRLPVTDFTVIAEVVSFEYYTASHQFAYDFIKAPYGWDHTIVAKIVAPENLAGREIALPFAPWKMDTMSLTKAGTLFRWESEVNLLGLKFATETLQRTAVPFPRRGIIALKPDGSVAELYPSVQLRANR